MGMKVFRFGLENMATSKVEPLKLQSPYARNTLSVKRMAYHGSGDTTMLQTLNSLYKSEAKSDQNRDPPSVQVSIKGFLPCK
jgi:hypothetical protein